MMLPFAVSIAIKSLQGLTRGGLQPETPADGIVISPIVCWHVCLSAQIPACHWEWGRFLQAPSVRSAPSVQRIKSTAQHLCAASG